MTPPPALFRATDCHEALRHLQGAALAGIQSGEFKPLAWPYRALGAHFMILYMLIPPTKSKSVYYLRIPLIIFIIFHSLEGIIWCRSPMPTIGYAVGLLNSLLLLQCLNLFIVNDARSSFKRLEKRCPKEQPTTTEVGNGSISSQSQITGSDPVINGIRRRIHSEEKTSSPNDSASPRKGDQSTPSYHWQALPTHFLHRLEWVSDLCLTFRAPRWSHSVSGLIPPPAEIQKQVDTAFHPPTELSTLTTDQLGQKTLRQMLLGIFMLDLLKTITMYDPFFCALGPASPSPFPYPKVTRVLLSVIYVYFALNTIFQLSPLVFGYLMGPRLLGQNAWPWLYAPQFGPLKSVAKNGLAGAWGQWWHQLFRLQFEQAGEAAAMCLGGEYVNSKTKKGKMLRMFVAFAISGLIHALASYTSLGPTRPVAASFCFFMVQPFGIIIQRALSTWLKKVPLLGQSPVWLKYISNWLFVVIWFSLTGPMIAAEFAATGVWLWEPVPISLFRGILGQGWWRWSGTWVRIYIADRSWESGIAV